MFRTLYTTLIFTQSYKIPANVLFIINSIINGITHSFIYAIHALVIEDIFPNTFDPIQYYNITVMSK